MLAIVCPGQGSQVPGFLAPWLELPGFADRMEWLGACAGMDLVAHGTTSDADTIRDTAVAQPLIVASGLVSFLALFEHPAEAFGLIRAGAGHSVGEITAAVGAGVLSAEQAMVFVRERGRLMAGASAVTPTGMSAVVGGDEGEVLAAIAAAGCTPANRNGAKQIVAAGTSEQLAALGENPPARARVIPLQVAGAFHTHHMAPAVDTLAGYSRAMTTRDARLDLVSNREGDVIRSGQEVLDRLVSQVSNPVRWDACMDTLADMGVTAVIEIPPAGTLTGLVKKHLKGVEALALKTPDDLAEARRLIREHGETATQGTDHPTWRMLVSPGKGTVSLADSPRAGRTVATGDRLAAVSTLRENLAVTAVHAGQVVEWLVEDGDPVAPGQPLVRLHPTEDA
ncbi:[acyl-carrier-protein] S-malonyltransferase [Kytococcus aerolatus]|uniref:[acyl-carrier-protein] S-malonyltransferase n=1 Tax=Kytococcus aerolatus TaxID=592308 RepID=A0A212U2I9_9MICO|nr:acyltransferase domain-containing protein [Kytococcus aerolatus]SNC72469.1 [acyl-carrier-protein] S-malonyltransferase [Kytococcus aerolatus]